MVLFWKDKIQKPDAPKTFHIAIGFFYIINFIVGTGFLGIPYSFYYSGYLAAIPTMLFAMVACGVNANYLLECMARAQALESHHQCQSTGVINYQQEKSQLHDKSKTVKFEITMYRKFEIVEMCGIFYNKWIKYLYIFVYSTYGFLGSWSGSTVAGSAWASNIPFNFSTVKQCNEDDFQHLILPPEPCLNSYYICLAIFGFFVIILSLLDLKEQAIVQVLLGLLRFVTIGAIVLYSLVKIFETGNKCLEIALPSTNETNYTLTNATHSPPIMMFNFLNWISAIPVITYAFIFHQGLPSMTHPIKQKKYLHWLILAMFVAAGICYFSIGIILPLWFRVDIQETCTLNWVELTKPSSSLALRILSYYIILFPSLDVVSAYPLGVHTTVNNIYVIITGKDTSEKPTHRFAKYDLFFRLFLRFICALLPILASAGVSNLIYVLNYAGLFGFAICFGFPTALQLRSIYVCKKKFANVLRNEPLEIRGGVHSVQETTPLLSNPDIRSRNVQSLYMTPYSNRLFSHPIAVCLIGAVGFVLFCLTFASLFTTVFYPQDVETCYSGLNF